MIHFAFSHGAFAFFFIFFFEKGHLTLSCIKKKYRQNLLWKRKNELKTQVIIADLQKKMVLLAGPRQAGKTTLAKEIGSECDETVYLNYDSTSDRKIIMEEAWLPSKKLLILD